MGRTLIRRGPDPRDEPIPMVLRDWSAWSATERLGHPKSGKHEGGSSPLRWRRASRLRIFQDLIRAYGFRGVCLGLAPSSGSCFYFLKGCFWSAGFRSSSAIAQPLHIPNSSIVIASAWRITSGSLRIPPASRIHRPQLDGAAAAVDEVAVEEKPRTDRVARFESALGPSLRVSNRFGPKQSSTYQEPESNHENNGFHLQNPCFLLGKT